MARTPFIARSTRSQIARGIGVLAVALTAVTSAACAGSGGTVPGEETITKSTTRIASVDLADPNRDTAKTCRAATDADPGAADPRRILVTDVALLDALCGLGIQSRVVGAPTVNGTIPAGLSYLGPWLAAVPQIGNQDAIDPAKASATDPDLVLSLGPDPVAEQVKAHSVSIEPNQSWQNTFLAVARAVGRSAAGQERLDDLGRITKDIGRGTDAAHTQASLVRFGDDSISVQGTAPFAAQIMTMLGVQRPPAQRVPGPIPVTDKNLKAADADIIYTGFSTPDQAFGRKVLTSDSWLALGAPTWKRVFIVDDPLWFGPGGLAAAWCVVWDIQITINSASS